MIEKIVLFGSRARGDYHRSSDIDLAVYGGDVTGFSLDVEEYTSTLLTYLAVLCRAHHEDLEKEKIESRYGENLDIL